MSPKRIQMSRQHPWRPDNPDAVIVARPSKWGNPASIVGKRVLLAGVEVFTGSITTTDRQVREFAVRSFRWQLGNHPNLIGYTEAEVRAELAGRDLACWCPLDQPCHADILLTLANGEPDER